MRIQSMCAAVSQCDIAGVKRLWRFARDTKEAIRSPILLRTLVLTGYVWSYAHVRYAVV